MTDRKKGRAHLGQAEPKPDNHPSHNLLEQIIARGVIVPPIARVVYIAPSRDVIGTGVSLAISLRGSRRSARRIRIVGGIAGSLSVRIFDVEDAEQLVWTVGTIWKSCVGSHTVLPVV